MTQTIAIISTKGGVGKTTLTANLGGLLAALGQRVLMLDADVGQASLSRCFELSRHAESGMAELLLGGGHTILSEQITPTVRPNLHIVVNNLGEDAQEFLRKRGDGQFILKRAVQTAYVRENYDFVLIDTQGTKGELQRCAATAADFLLSPFKPGPMELAEFKPGTLEMLEAINHMADFTGVKAGQLLVVINCAPRTKVAREIAEHLRTGFADAPDVRVLNAFLPEAKAFPEARIRMTPVHESDPPRITRTVRRPRPTGYEAMHRLIFEIAPHLNGKWVGVNLDGGES